MRAIFLATSAFIAISMSGTTAAKAADRAFCMTGQITLGQLVCDFDTYQQCRATASGQAAECVQNPKYIARGYFNADPYDAPQPRPRRQYY